MKITKEMKDIFKKSLTMPPRKNTHVLLFNSWMEDCTYERYYCKAKACYEKILIQDDYEKYMADMDEICLEYYKRYMKALNSI